MRRTIVLLIFIISILISGCNSKNIISKWDTGEMNIDGNDDEWTVDMVKYDDLYIGAVNNDEFLYLCISGEKDSTQMSGMFNRYFMIWFDPMNKKGKTFGLNFKNREINKTDNPPDNLFKTESPINLKVDVINNNKIIKNDELIKGIEGVLKINDDNTFICKLKIPIRSKGEIKYAINPINPKKIGYLIESSYFSPDMKEGHPTQMKDNGNMGKPPMDGENKGKRMPPPMSEGSNNPPPPPDNNKIRGNENQNKIHKISIEGTIQLAKSK
jgi:hypothetical protein